MVALLFLVYYQGKKVVRAEQSVKEAKRVLEEAMAINKFAEKCTELDKEAQDEKNRYAALTPEQRAAVIKRLLSDGLGSKGTDAC